MKCNYLLLYAFMVFQINVTQAQVNSALTTTGVSIDMLFPGGKPKALILSFDDSPDADRKMVALMNKYGLKGTFHLNSNKLGLPNYLTKAEIKSLFVGHEVSVHTANHPHLYNLPKNDIVYEVVEDRKELERLVGYPVRGMAYPFGDCNSAIIDAISGMGIEYARTVNDTYQFGIPQDFLQWHPTAHFFGRAYSDPHNLANDQLEVARFFETVNRFIQTKDLAVMDIWGHSWELGDDAAKWKDAEKCYQMLTNDSSVYSATQIDLVDYIHAFRELKISVDKKIIFNPSAFTIFFKKNQKVFSVKPGGTLVLND